MMEKHSKSSEQAQPATCSSPAAWLEYTTPPRRIGHKRSLAVSEFPTHSRQPPHTSKVMSQQEQQHQLPRVSPETPNSEIPQMGISRFARLPQHELTPVPLKRSNSNSSSSSSSNNNNSGIFRRLRTRRARRLAEYEKATLVQSPPSSGNSAAATASGVGVFCCIPAEHPGKILWDTLTVLLSLANAYYTHVAIRERRFDDAGTNTFRIFAGLWFLVDILLNFVTEHRIGNVTLKTVSAVSARYLTTWFVIDLLSLVPGEKLYVQPVINQIKSRGLFKKWFFRTKSVSKVTGKLLPRWRELRQFGALYRKHKGLGGMRRLIVRLIKYLPKYVLFLRHMKGVIALRCLRQLHWFRKGYYNILNLIRFVYKTKKEEPDEFVIRKAQNYQANYESDDDTFTMTYDDDDESREYFWEEEDDEGEFDDGDPY